MSKIMEYDTQNTTISTILMAVLTVLCSTPGVLLPLLRVPLFDISATDTVN
jgi:hypothetical protein